MSNESKVGDIVCFRQQYLDMPKGMIGVVIRVTKIDFWVSPVVPCEHGKYGYCSSVPSSWFEKIGEIDK